MEFQLNPKFQPLFIFGFPKSGTTLLLSLLDSHSDLLVFPEETGFFLNDKIKINKKNIPLLLNSYPFAAFNHGQLNIEAGSFNYSSIDYLLFCQLFVEYLRIHGYSKKKFFESIIWSYGKLTHQLDKRIWVEKTPGHERSLSEIKNFWPQYKAIYIYRDPRDIYESYRRKRKNRNQETSLSLFMSRWLKSIRIWENTLPNKNHLTIKYEDLVRYPKSELNKITEFLGIKWEESLLQPTKNGFFWDGNSMFGHRFQNISPLPISRYKNVLSKEKIFLLECFLKNEIRQRGYSIENNEDSKDFFSRWTQISRHPFEVLEFFKELVMKKKLNLFKS